MTADALRPDDPIRVLAGLSKGARGAVVARWHDFAPGIPSYCVRLDGESRLAILREDYLEKVERRS